MSAKSHSDVVQLRCLRGNNFAEVTAGHDFAAENKHVGLVSHCSFSVESVRCEVTGSGKNDAIDQQEQSAQLPGDSSRNHRPVSMVRSCLDIIGDNCDEAIEDV